MEPFRSDMEPCRGMWNPAGGYGTLQVDVEPCRWIFNPAGGCGTLQVDGTRHLFMLLADV